MAPKKKKMTPAEKQRAYRQRIAANPEKREAAKEKERLRWKSRREEKKVKYVADMTQREHRVKRKNWRKAYCKRKAEKERLAWLEEQEAAILTGNPPTSPPHGLPHQAPQPQPEPQQQPQPEPQHQPEPLPGTSGNSTSAQKKRGRKKVRKDRTACYRNNKKLIEKLENEKRKNQTLRKQLSRTNLSIKVSVGQKHKHGDVCASDADSPRKRARLTMNSGQGVTRKELIFHYALTQQIKHGKQTCEKNQKRAQLFTKLFGYGNVLSKYRLLTKAHKTGLFSKRLLKKNAKHRNEDLLVYERAKKRNCVKEAVKQTIKMFFERDDVSWCAAGKKQVITCRKVKKQKRFLLDSVRSMYIKYLHLHPVRPVSLSTFWKQKPFWVVKPKLSDRETCLCKAHENVRFLHDKLKSLGYLLEKSADETINQVVCSRDNKDCMYRDCAKCKHAEVVFSQTESTGQENQTWWWQWKSADHTYKDKEGQLKTTKKTIKEKVEGTVTEMKGEYKKQIQKYSTHVYNIMHQFQVCREKKNQLGEDEALLHVDFAENWTMKSLRQIQSDHYGASNSQITLHTGVAYVGGMVTRTTVPFCSLSDNNKHAPSTVWCHLIPILRSLRENHRTTKLHFMSDGPVTQYRGRHNLHLLCNIPFQMGFKEIWWNFSEAGHGKGACDGVGATIKRLADAVTMTGTDIHDADSLVKHLEDKTNIKLYMIPEDAEISNLPAVPAVKGVMRVHQIYSQRPGIILTRDVSCYCGPQCDCYSPSEHDVLQSSYDRHIFAKPSCEVGQVVKQPDVQQVEALVIHQDDTHDINNNKSDPKPVAQQVEALVIHEDDTHDINNNKSDPKHDNSWLQIGCYAVVRCGEKYYPGMVISVEGDSYEMKYLKQTGSYHEWMSGFSSSSWQPREDVLEQLHVPDMDRRGHVIFRKNDLETITKYK